MISIIIPVRNEENNILPLHNKIKDAAKKFKDKFEIIFIDDASTDKSFSVLKKIDNKNTTIIKLAINSGQTQALAVGLKYAKGNIIVFMDADMQNDPFDIPKMLSEMHKGYDVISGWRVKRKDKFFTRIIPSKIANYLISKITKLKLHDYGCSLKVYKREVLKNLEFFGEIHRIFPALAYWKGYKIKEVKVLHHHRLSGKSKYGMLRTFKVIIDLISVKFFSSYSNCPNYLFGGTGIFFIILGFLMCVVTFMFSVERGVLLGTLIILIGIQLVLMGLLADILVRIYHSVSKNHKKHIIQEIIEKKI